ncbi:MAG TPA: NAD(P)H-dependent oxidoreductase [Caulobacteraceae bacterium]|nr:NAD(P)H-dependent oxidoreductase [Caulobacteraceae bacterium]
MRHAVILSHPDPASFNAAVAKTYTAAVAALGQEASMRDLYAEGFDPRLPAAELPWRPDFRVSDTIAAERARLATADVIAFVYPLWFNAPPAMLKGYVERVFGMGFGYGSDGGGTRPLLMGKSLVSISTSGAPNAWVGQTGVTERLREGFDDHLAAVCGLSVLDHLHLGGITPGIREDAGKAMLDHVAQLVRRHFAPARQAGAAIDG